MNILLLSYHFPPTSDVGGRRASMISKYLKKEGNEIHILTSKDVYGIDKTVCKGEIHRVRSLLPMHRGKSVYNRIYRKLLRIILPIDIFYGWKYPAIFRAKKLIQEKNIDICIATGPPFTTFCVAYHIARRIPVILDYRDPWTYYDWVRTPNSNIEKKEKRCLTAAKRVIVVTDLMKTEYDHRKKMNEPKCIVITNGYEEIEEEELQPNTKRKIILHAGTYYGGRTAKPIIEAIKELNEEGIHIVFQNYGRMSVNDMEYAKEIKAEKYIVQKEKYDYSSILKKMQQADILYLPTGNEYRYAVPYKMYDYMSARTPVIAMTNKETEVYRYMDENELGTCITLEEDIHSVKDKIRKMLCYRIESKNSQKYHWTNVIKAYQNVIEECVGERHIRE